MENLDILCGLQIWLLQITSSAESDFSWRTLFLWTSDLVTSKQHETPPPHPHPKLNLLMENLTTFCGIQIWLHQTTPYPNPNNRNSSWRTFLFGLHISLPQIPPPPAPPPSPSSPGSDLLMENLGITRNYKLRDCILPGYHLVLVQCTWSDISFMAIGNKKER